jgi:hypothetical protein
MTKEWMEVSELRSNKQCLELGREFGATGVIIGLLSQNGDSGDLTIHLAGFGPAARKSEIFEPIGETAHFPKTEQLVELLAQPAANFTRNFDAIPNEPGVLSHNDPGVSRPGCIRCPDPQYSGAARKAKIQGKAVLSRGDDRRESDFNLRVKGGADGSHGAGHQRGQVVGIQARAKRR